MYKCTISKDDHKGVTYLTKVPENLSERILAIRKCLENASIEIEYLCKIEPTIASRNSVVVAYRVEYKTGNYYDFTYFVVEEIVPLF